MTSSATSSSATSSSTSASSLTPTRKTAIGSIVGSVVGAIAAVVLAVVAVIFYHRRHFRYSKTRTIDDLDLAEGVLSPIRPPTIHPFMDTGRGESSSFGG